MGDLKKPKAPQAKAENSSTNRKIFVFGACILVLFLLLLAIGWCVADRTDAVTFVQWFEGTVAFTGLIISIAALGAFKDRLENQERQTKIQTGALQNQEEQTASQIRKEIDERFNSAIALLGSDKTSARTGAVYALYELAAESEKYLIQIVKVLCGHIRAQTQGKEYQEANAEFPSDDVQTAINVLFKREHEGDMPTDDEKLLGLYMKFAGKLPRANLHRAYLVGANFYEAECQRTVFGGANCQKAWFGDANCKFANFVDADCQGADFAGVDCQGASFENANCQGTKFNYAACQQAKFWKAQCQSAVFSDAQCQGANFVGANLQGADFMDADTTGTKGLDEENDD